VQNTVPSGITNFISFQQHLLALSPSKRERDFQHLLHDSSYGSPDICLLVKSISQYCVWESFVINFKCTVHTDLYFSVPSIVLLIPLPSSVIIQLCICSLNEIQVALEISFILFQVPLYLLFQCPLFSPKLPYEVFTSYKIFNSIYLAKTMSTLQKLHYQGIYSIWNQTSRIPLPLQMFAW
jgi:hypothetical protein